MGTFLVTTPEGKKYKVTAPSAESANASVQKMLGGAATAATPPAHVTDPTSLETPWGPGTGSLTPYEPSMRDKASIGLQNLGMARGGAAALVGSSGLGPETHGTKAQPFPGMGAIDMTGLGIPFSIDEAQRSAEASNPVGAVANSLAMIPGAKAVTTPIARAVSPIVEAARRLKVALPRAASTDSMLVQRIGQAAGNVPIGGTPLKKASEGAINQLGQATETVAKGFGKGGAVTADVAGDTARTALENYIGPVTKAKADKAYAAVDALVDQNALSTLDSTAKVATSILQKRAASKLPDRMGPAVKMVSEAASAGDGLTYEGIKRLRTEVGELLASADRGAPLPAGMSGGELKQIYGALTEDLKAAVKGAGGPDALAKFERANKYYELISERRKNLVRLLGAKNDEGVFNRLVDAASSGRSADINLLMQARKAIPGDEWDDIASGVIANLGKTPQSGMRVGATSVPGDFSPERFVTSWSKLSPQGRSVLFGSTGRGSLVEALDDIATVSTRFKELNRLANPSGTAQTLVGVGQIGALAGDPLSLLGSVVGPNIIARVLAKPSTARATARWSRSYVSNFTSPNKAALAFQGRVLATEVGKELGWTAEQVKRLTESLTGGGTGPTSAEPGQPQ